jgi:hypothetical protein
MIRPGKAVQLAWYLPLSQGYFHAPEPADDGTIAVHA